jgi:hypothetical protein
VKYREFKDNIKNRTLTNEKTDRELFLNSRQRISELQKIPNVVQELVPEIPQQKKFDWNAKCYKTRCFLSFIALSLNLIACI